MIVKIDNLSHDFRGICRINDKVTFVDRVLPNEIVDISITKEKKNFNEGRVNSFIEKSSVRVDNKCPYFDRCGGCSFGYIDYDKGLEYKKNIFIDIFNRYAKINITPNVISSDEIIGYRNKISMKVYDGKLSLVLEESNDYVNINRCLLVNDKINNVIELLNNINLDGIRDVIIRGNDSIMIIINGEYDYNKIINLLDGSVNSIIYNGKCIYGDEYIVINIGKYKYAVYPDSFFQVNTDMISKLYDKVKEYSGKGNRLLDLYCGAGTIGIYLSDNFNDVRGIEINSDAIKGANVNKDINNISNVSFMLGNANNTYIDEDVIVVDPPRSGLDDKTRNLLLNSSVNRIVYVSCNPITLARDINVLKEIYDLKDITLFDNFPNTKHMESVCVLERI